MNITSATELLTFVDFMKWKRENPEDYKQFLKDLKEFKEDMEELWN